MKAKRNLFAAIGWMVWKLLALLGWPYAKKKVKERAANGKRHAA